jgi:hypothetical protein
MKSLLIKLGVIGFIIFSFVEVKAEEKYLCVAERSTGFAYNEFSKSWESTNFKTDAKYMISKSSDKGDSFKVTKIGDDYQEFECQKGFNEYGYLLCEGVGEFRFNKKNKRFIKIYPIGYYNVLPEINKVTDKSSDTPFIEIGKCSPF